MSTIVYRLSYNKRTLTLRLVVLERRVLWLHRELKVRGAAERNKASACSIPAPYKYLRTTLLLLLPPPPDRGNSSLPTMVVLYVTERLH